MKLEHVLLGSQVGADPTEHPRWDGHRIRPYDEPATTAGDEPADEEPTT